MKLLYPFCIPNFFADAGQSVVERALLAELPRNGVELRLVTDGDASEQDRLAEYVGSLPQHAAVEIIPVDDARSDDALEGVDALILHSLPLGKIAPWLDRHAGVTALPTVQFVHSLLLAEFEQVMWGDMWSRWPGWPPARLVAPSRCTAARARTLASSAVERGGRLPSVEVISHGVDRAAIEQGDRRAARSCLGADDETLVILSVNRISRAKAAYPELILAFHALLQLPRAKELLLVIAGSVAGQDQRYLSSLRVLARQLGVADRVRFVTAFEDSEKGSLYAAADVYVSLANNPQESFGVALLEALAAGLPVVATEWNGYPEVLPPVYEGLMVPTVASHAVAQAIDWSTSSDACAPAFDAIVALLGALVADPERRAALASAGPPLAEQRSWQRAAGSIIELLETLIADSKGSVATGGEPGPVSPPPRSMVDGLASTYLDDDPVLRLSAAASGPRRRQVRRMLWYRLPRPYGSDEERDPAPGVRPPRLQRLAWAPARRGRAVLNAAAEAGEAGVSTSALRARTGLPDAEADWLLLQLIRGGLLDVAPSAARPSG